MTLGSIANAWSLFIFSGKAFHSRIYIYLFALSVWDLLELTGAGALLVVPNLVEEHRIGAIAASFKVPSFLLLLSSSPFLLLCPPPLLITSPILTLTGIRELGVAVRVRVREHVQAGAPRRRPRPHLRQILRPLPPLRSPTLHGLSLLCPSSCPPFVDQESKAGVQVKYLLVLVSIFAVLFAVPRFFELDITLCWDHYESQWSYAISFQFYSLLSSLPSS